MEIKICENCGVEHDGKYASGRFCSKSCSKSFIAKKVKNRKSNLPITEIDLEFLHTKNIKEQKWKCSHCGACFPTRKVLYLHTGEHHSNYDETGKKVIWNKGLTCETSSIMRKIVATKAEKYKNGELVGSFKGKHHTEKSKKLISEKLSINNKGGRCKWFEVDGQKVQGTWEKNVCEILSNENIRWKKIKNHTLSFKYDVNGVVKTYTPDIHLLDYDIKLEIKGYWWGDDKNKMQRVRDCNTNTKVMIIDSAAYEKIISEKSIKNILFDSSLLLENYNFG